MQAHYDARVVSMTTLGDVTEDGTQETKAILINEQEAQRQVIRDCSSSFVFYTVISVLAYPSVIFREDLLEEVALPLGFPGGNRGDGRDPGSAWRTAQDNTHIWPALEPPGTIEPGCHSCIHSANTPVSPV